jgi:hypothetical protein
VENGLGIALTDTGEPLIDNAPSTNVQFAGLPEGGFGWFLKKMFAQNITYKRTNSINTLAFHLPIRVKISA